MRQLIVKYSEEQINKFLMGLVEKLSNYEYVKYLKDQRELNLNDSLDIIV